MVLSISKVDENGLGVPDVQEPIRLGRKSRVDQTTGGGKMLFTKIGM